MYTCFSLDCTNVLMLKFTHRQNSPFMSRDAKKLNKDWLEETDIMIRRPSDDEQRFANVKTSDYQISSITIQSSILHALGLLDKVYRSKSSTVSLSTSNKIKKYRSIIDKLFFNLKFIKSSEEFFDFINDIESVTNFTKIELKFFLKSQKKWENVLDKDHILPIVVPFVKENPDSIEYTEQDVSKCKEYYNIIHSHLEKQSNLFDNPALYFNVLTLISSFHSIFNDEIIVDFKEDVENFKGDIPSFKNFIFDYLKSKDRGSIKKHTQTIINETSIERQKEILETIKNDGIGDKLNIFTFVQYLNYYKPHIFDKFKEECGLDIRDFSSFDELCDELYKPHNINKIRNGLGVHVRARCTGDLRKGAELIIEQKRYNNKRENAKRRLGCEISNYNYENDVYLLEQKSKLFKELEEKNEKYKSLLTDLKNKIILAKEQENKIQASLLRSEYRKIDTIYKECHKDYKEVKREYKKLFQEIQSKKRAYDTIKHYERLELEMFDNMKQSRHNDDFYEISLLEQRTRNNFIIEDKIPYFTWQFICYDMSSESANLLCEMLEKHLNEGSGICGELGYINAAAYMVGYHLGRPLTHFFIDYPKSAAIYKAFKKKKNLSEILLKGFSDCMKIPIICVKDETKYNVPMEITLKEDIYTWDNFWN